jgi:hypothetical protein
VRDGKGNLHDIRGTGADTVNIFVKNSCPLSLCSVVLKPMSEGWGGGGGEEKTEMSYIIPCNRRELNDVSSRLNQETCFHTQ